ncbi:MAG: BMP family ABC transporter substrate-binding protein [Spirochaetes bacterium]|jgi:basic membrane protein A|nr:BMP family ABC transporter substrate-binding protein [Spirochaetota bacterium]
MNTRTISLSLVLLLVLGTAGVFAGGGAEAEGEGGDTPFRVAVVMPSATTDTAFSQSMWSALTTVQEEMGGESALELVYSENMFNVPDASAAVRDYASQGYDLVIAHGSQYGTFVEDLAPEFPETAFAWGTDVNTFGLDNVYAYTAAAEEGGYVNGIMAGLMTESGRIGVTGPVEVGDARTYISGFVQGVEASNPDAQISQTWTGSFSDVALMTAAAQTHISNGADVLTGSSQSVVGSIGAAQEEGDVLWFGTQANQTSLAPDLVVASQVYDWTMMLEEMIMNAQSGVYGGETYILTLSNEGLKIAYNENFDIPAEVTDAAESAIEGIVDGSVTVEP